MTLKKKKKRFVKEKSGTTYIPKAHKRQFLASCLHLTGRQHGCQPFPNNMLSAQSVRHTRMLSYLQSDIPVLLIGPVASRRVNLLEVTTTPVIRQSAAVVSRVPSTERNCRAHRSDGIRRQADTATAADPP